LEDKRVILDLLVFLGVRELLGHQGPLGLLVILDLKENPGLRVLGDQLELLEGLEHQVSQGLRVRVETLEMQEL